MKLFTSFLPSPVTSAAHLPRRRRAISRRPAGEKVGQREGKREGGFARAELRGKQEIESSFRFLATATIYNPECSSPSSFFLPIAPIPFVTGSTRSCFPFSSPLYLPFFESKIPRRKFEVISGSQVSETGRGKRGEGSDGRAIKNAGIRSKLEQS